MQNNPAFSTLLKSKNTDIIFHFPVPKRLEIHSEWSDWIIKSSVGKIQPFRNIVKLYNGSKATQTPAFQSFKISSGCRTAVSGVQWYNRKEAFSKKFTFIQIVLHALSKVRLPKPKARKVRIHGETKGLCLRLFSNFSFTFNLFLHLSCLLEAHQGVDHTTRNSAMDEKFKLILQIYES